MLRSTLENYKNSKRDPVLLERAVYAFGLLEALARVGMPFIFKGGTCLMLLMDPPRRLSTDIDIIVEPETDLDEYLAKASEIFPFKTVEEQKRVGKDNIEKRHFKFIYDSPINDRPFYILLDVFTDFKQIGPTYEQIAKAEIAYRGIESSAEDYSPEVAAGRIFEKAIKIWVRGYSNSIGDVIRQLFS